MYIYTYWHIRTSHVVYIIESCHKYKWVSNLRILSHTYEWVISRGHDSTYWRCDRTSLYQQMHDSLIYSFMCGITSRCLSTGAFARVPCTFISGMWLIYTLIHMCTIHILVHMWDMMTHSYTYLSEGPHPGVHQLVHLKVYKSTNWQKNCSRLNE